MAFFKLSRRSPERVKRLSSRGVQTSSDGTTTSRRTSRPATTRGISACASCPTETSSSAIREGQASVVTDHIETFTEKGLKLRSGAELEADLIVTATGLNL